MLDHVNFSLFSINIEIVEVTVSFACAGLVVDIVMEIIFPLPKHSNAKFYFMWCKARMNNNKFPKIVLAADVTFYKQISKNQTLLIHM